MSDNGVVLDASALLALLKKEAGHEAVAKEIPNAVIGSVNLAEVASKLSEAGMPGSAVREALDGLGLDTRPFDKETAYKSGFLRPLTKEKGLPLGDLACLALGMALELPVLTTDRTWKGLDLDVEVLLARP